MLTVMTAILALQITYLIVGIRDKRVKTRHLIFDAVSCLFVLSAGFILLKCVDKYSLFYTWSAPHVYICSMSIFIPLYFIITVITLVLWIVNRAKIPVTDEQLKPVDVVSNTADEQANVTDSQNLNPNKQDSIPSETKEAPIETEKAPSETEKSPSETEEAPSDTEEAPSETEEAPSETEEAPSDTEEAPSETEEAPSKTDKAPSETDKAPSETDKTPSEAEKAPSETEEAPSETEKAPSETEEAPSETEEAPSETEKAPSETEEAPSETDKAQNVPERIPSMWGSATIASDNYTNIWDDTPSMPDNFPNMWDNTPSMPESFPNTWDNTPSMPDNFPNMWDSTPSVSDSTANVSGNISNKPNNIENVWTGKKSESGSPDNMWKNDIIRQGNTLNIPKNAENKQSEKKYSRINIPFLCAVFVLPLLIIGGFLFWKQINNNSMYAKTTATVTEFKEVKIPNLVSDDNPDGISNDPVLTFKADGKEISDEIYPSYFENRELEIGDVVEIYYIDCSKYPSNVPGMSSKDYMITKPDFVNYEIIYYSCFSVGFVFIIIGIIGKIKRSKKYGKSKKGKRKSYSAALRIIAGIAFLSVGLVAFSVQVEHNSQYRKGKCVSDRLTDDGRLELCCRVNESVKYYIVDSSFVSGFEKDSNNRYIIYVDRKWDLVIPDFKHIEYIFIPCIILGAVFILYGGTRKDSDERSKQSVYMGINSDVSNYGQASQSVKQRHKTSKVKDKEYRKAEKEFSKEVRKRTRFAVPGSEAEEAQSDNYFDENQYDDAFYEENSGPMYFLGPDVPNFNFDDESDKTPETEDLGKY